jgi:hypothetical protein
LCYTSFSILDSTWEKRITENWCLLFTDLFLFNDVVYTARGIALNEKRLVSLVSRVGFARRQS